MGTPVLEGVNACPVMRGRTGEHPALVNRRLALLASGSFVVATDGTLIVGLLRRVAADLSASPSATGQSIAVFALAYAAGAPLLIVLTRRLRQDRVLLAALILFAAANLATALAQSLASPPCGARARRGLRRRVYADGSGTRCSGVGPAARPRIGLRRQWRVGGGNRRCAVGNDPRRLPRLAFSVLSRSGDDLGAHCRAGERRQPQRRVVATRLFGLSAAPTSPDDADGDAALGRRQFHVLHVLRRRFSPRSASTAAASRSRKLSASADAN